MARRPSVHGVAVSLAVAFSLFAGASAHASCQTPYCHSQRELREAEREREAVEAITADPQAREAWHRLLRYLEDKPDRERRIAAYRSRLDWEPQPLLEDPRLEERLLEERLQWLALYRETFGDDGETLCRWARFHPEEEEALRVLQEVAARRPGDADLVLCLASRLRRAGREAEALALVEEVRDHIADTPEAYEAVAAAYGSLERYAQERAVLEARVARFPDEDAFRLDLLYHLARHEAHPALDVLLADLVASAETPEELHETCLRVEGEQRRWCHEETVRLGAEWGVEDEVVFARGELLEDAYASGRQAEVDRLLASWPESRLVYAWGLLWRNRDDERVCSRLLESFGHGSFEAALADPERGPESSKRLATLLEFCGAPKPAGALRARAAPHLSAYHLRAGDGPELLAEAWRRLEADPDGLHLRAAVLGHLRRLPPERRVSGLERLAALLPADVRTAVALAETLEELGDVDGTLAWLGEAAERAEGKDGAVDLTLRRAALALRHERDGTATGIARAVLRREGTARRHADARYVLGRVARREGRWDEASEHFVHYFLLRLRYQGCAAWRQCDLGLIYHLLEAHDPRRLEDYLERRDEAIRYFERTVGYSPATRGRPSLFQDDEYLQIAVRYLGCVAPGAIAYLEERVAAEPDDPDLRQRLAGARGERACEDAFEADRFFADDRLLSLAEEMTEVR